MAEELSRDILPGDRGEILRTILRKDVKDRLTQYAQSLATGMDKWDYGVAIERLLDEKIDALKLEQFEQRLDNIEFKLDNTEEEVEKKSVDLYGKGKEEL